MIYAKIFSLKVSSALAVLLASVLLGGCSSAPERTLEEKEVVQQKITDLARASAENQTACEKYIHDLEKSSGLKGRPSELSFKDRRIALGVLTKLENHPFTPRSTQEANRLILNEDPGALNFPSVAESLTQLQGFCGTVPTYVNFTRLVTGREKYQWSGLELERIKRIGLRWVEMESSFPGSLLSTRVAVSVLETLNDAGFFPGRDQLKDKILPLKDEIDELTAVIREKSNQMKPSASEDSATQAKEAAKLKVFEMEQAAKIRDQLRKLYIEVI